MSYDDCVRIERAANGYSVSMKDQKIVEQNMKRDLKSDYRAPYVDPVRQYVFMDYATLEAFLKANLEKALPKQSFESTFSAISSDDD